MSNDAHRLAVGDVEMKVDGPFQPLKLHHLSLYSKGYLRTRWAAQENGSFNLFHISLTP